MKNTIVACTMIAVSALGMIYAAPVVIERLAPKPPTLAERVYEGAAEMLDMGKLKSGYAAGYSVARLEDGLDYAGDVAANVGIVADAWLVELGWK
jgi:hypothetical protein